MQRGHIAAVELLTVGATDAEAIEEAKRAFQAQMPSFYEGFEVWDRARFIYRFPPDDPQS
jgi:hypothetical protein